MPSVSRSRRPRAAAKILAASWVAEPSERARVRILKSAVFSFSVMVEPARAPCLEPGGNLLRLAPENSFERTEIGDVALERRLGGHALGFAIGADLARVDAAREPGEAAAFLAVAAHQRHLADALQIGDAVEAVAGEPRRAHLADAEDEAHRLFGEECLRLAPAQDRKAARLVEIGGDLGEKFVAGKPDRDGDAELLVRRRRQSAQAPWRAADRAAARCPRDRETPRRSRAARPAGSAPASSAGPRGRRANICPCPGRTTRACGHSRSASNIGIADRTP